MKIPAVPYLNWILAGIGSAMLMPTWNEAIGLVLVVDSILMTIEWTRDTR